MSQVDQPGTNDPGGTGGVLGPPAPDAAPTNALQGWQRLSVALVRTLPAGLRRAERSRRRIAKGR